MKEEPESTLTKTYELLLAGRHAPTSAELRLLGEPLTHRLGLANPNPNPNPYPNPNPNLNP